MVDYPITLKTVAANSKNGYFNFPLGYTLY